MLSVLAAERTATNSRLASTLLDCISQGSNKHSVQHPQHPTQGRLENGNAPPSTDATQQPVIIVACVESAEDVAPSLRRCFTHELQLEAPDGPARKRLLQVCSCSAQYAIADAAVCALEMYVCHHAQYHMFHSRCDGVLWCCLTAPKGLRRKLTIAKSTHVCPDCVYLAQLLSQLLGAVMLGLQQTLYVTEQVTVSVNSAYQRILLTVLIMAAFLLAISPSYDNCLAGVAWPTHMPTAGTAGP